MRNISSRKLHSGLVALAALSSVLATGCSSEGIVDAPEAEGVPFEVKASISATSRAATDLHSAQYFAAGEKVRIFVRHPTSVQTMIIDDIYTFSDGTGHLTAATPHYISPAVSGTFYVLGLYPSTITYADLNLTSTIGTSFTVEENQSEDTNYNNSDLMTAVGDVTYDNPQVELTFKHMLTKIIFNLTYTNENATVKAEDAEVCLLNIYPTAKSSAVLPGLASTFAADQTSTPTTIIVKEALKKSTSVAVIIPQQSIASTADFLRITLDGRTFTGSLPSDTNFKGGCVYTYDVTIKDSNFYVSQASVAAWGTDTTTSGGSITVTE